MTTRATGVRAAAAGTPATTHDGLDAYEAFRARRHMPSLDGIRCLAIVAVLWHHSPHADSVPVTRGFLGVDLFFVLSGFLITTLLLREQDAAGGRIDLRAFYVRRILRIFPLYYAVLFGQAVALLLFRPHSPVADEFFAALPWYATYTANFGVHDNLFAHAWSLAVEEQFYLLWPPVLAWCTRRGARALLVAYLLVTAALDWGLAGAGAQQVALYMTPFAAIGCGVLLAFGLHDRATFGRIAPIVGWRGFVFLPLVALAALVCVPGDLAGWPRAAIYVAMTALIAAVVVPEDHALSSVLRHRAVVHVGTVSYGMYLLHQLCFVPVARLLGRDPAHGVWFFLLGTAVTVAVATLSYRSFESRFLRRKARWVPRR